MSTFAVLPRFVPPQKSILMKSKPSSLKKYSASWRSWFQIPTPMPILSLSKMLPQVFSPPSE